MIKKMKKNEKNPGKIAIFHFFENCNFPRVFFFIFFSFFFIFSSFFIIVHHFSSIPPLEAKIIKKMIKNEKNSRNIAFFYFSETFCTTGSKNDEQ